MHYSLSDNDTLKNKFKKYYDEYLSNMDNNNFAKDIGWQLRNMREHCETPFSIEEFSEITHYSIDHISEIENGTMLPDIRFIYMYCFISNHVIGDVSYDMHIKLIHKRIIKTSIKNISPTILNYRLL